MSNLSAYRPRYHIQPWGPPPPPPPPLLYSTIGSRTEIRFLLHFAEMQDSWWQSEYDLREQANRGEGWGWWWGSSVRLRRDRRRGKWGGKSIVLCQPALTPHSLPDEVSSVCCFLLKAPKSNHYWFWYRKKLICLTAREQVEEKSGSAQGAVRWRLGHSRRRGKRGILCLWRRERWALSILAQVVRACVRERTRWSPVGTMESCPRGPDTSAWLRHPRAAFPPCRGVGGLSPGRREETLALRER